jgi:S1-C subfamily serine protease
MLILPLAVHHDGATGARAGSTRALAAAGVAGLLALGGCSSTRATVSSPKGKSPTITATSGAGGNAVDTLESAFEAVVNKVRPSVVEISTPDGLGSGILYDSRGDVVTNNHVVGTAASFTVTFGDGRTATASLVGTYAPDDLAVIKVNGITGLPPAATFADSSKVKVGQLSFAIGNPLGLASSVTEGIVSFNGRNVSEGNGVVLPATIQTSAPINPGNSGGALVDIDGAVIGIPTLAASDPQLGGGAAPGIGFAIPSNTVKLIADQLVRDGKVSRSGRAALGITATDVVDATGQPAGVLVRAVQPGSAAAQAGLHPGDVITAIDGQPTPDLASLADRLATHRPGDGVKVTIAQPDGSKRDYSVTLGNLPG